MESSIWADRNASMPTIHTIHLEHTQYTMNTTFVCISNCRMWYEHWNIQPSRSDQWSFYCFKHAKADAALSLFRRVDVTRQTFSPLSISQIQSPNGSIAIAMAIFYVIHYDVYIAGSSLCFIAFNTPPNCFLQITNNGLTNTWNQSKRYQPKQHTTNVQFNRNVLISLKS